MKTILIIALGLAATGTAAMTFAQTAAQPAGERQARHAKLDTNGDGVIDRSEAAKAPKFAEHFDKLDANKDGRITADERPQRGMRGGKGGQGDRMAQLDTNKDGRFSREELAGKERVLQNFAAIDVNGDGALSREEMQAHHKAHRGERGAARQPK